MAAILANLAKFRENPSYLLYLVFGTTVAGTIISGGVGEALAVIKDIAVILVSIIASFINVFYYIVLTILDAVAWIVDPSNFLFLIVTGWAVTLAMAFMRGYSIADRISNMFQYSAYYFMGLFNIAMKIVNFIVGVITAVVSVL